MPILSNETIDFWLQRFDPSLSVSRTYARLIERSPVAHDTVSLRFAANRWFRGYRPGQHLNLTAEIDGRRLTRCYSFTTPPGPGRTFSLVVKRIEHGRMSEFLTRRLRVGQAVEVSAAFGDLGFAAEDARPRLLLAGGVGITPMLAHVRSLAAASSPVSTVLLYWARRRIDLCFASELEALAARLPSLSVRMLLTRSERPDPRLDAASLAALVPDLADRTVLACGPGGFVEAARSAAADRSALFRSEAFEPLRAAAIAGGDVVVRLLRRGKELRIPRGQPLLQALEAAGMTLPSGCRMGICNTCACSALAGQTRDLRSQTLSSGDARAVRLCVSAAETDLTLDL